MTQPTDILTSCVDFQLELMAALKATWAKIKDCGNPVLLREARDKARAIGDLAAMARKVALMTPRDRAKPLAAAQIGHAAASLHASESVAKVQAMLAESTAAAAERKPAAQVEQARRALDKLKGGRRGRL